MESVNANKWSGLRGQLGAWFLSSPLRGAMDRVGGDTRSRCLSALELKGDEVVVDVGCGSGFYSVPIIKRLTSGRLIGVDGSPVMLSFLERRVRREGLERRVELREGDATALPIEDEGADVALTTSLLHELSEPDRAVAELARVLKPGGRVAVVDFRAAPLLTQRLAASHHEGAHGAWTEAGLQELLEAAGFEQVEVEPRRAFLIGLAQKPR